MVHDFLAKLIRLESFQTAEEEKGRLRGFLGTALSRFLSSWHVSQNKRSHDVSLDEELDLATAEQQFKEVLENNGQVMEAYDWLAKTHTAQAEYAAAQAILQNAVRLSPTISRTISARLSSESAASTRCA